MLMKKKFVIVLVLIAIDSFLLCTRIFGNKKSEELNRNIEEKEQLIIDNDLKISSLQATIAEAEKNNDNVEKEYKVWVHQNEKLENILH